MITESASHYDHLEQRSVHDLLISINKEDKTVPDAVEQAIPQIEALVSRIVARMRNGGRLIYIGAGTSGRLGVVDASECPPTYGVPFDLVIGLMAGGDGAIRKAVENAEDDAEQAWKDIAPYQPTPTDTVIGIAASGRTPYVISGLNQARAAGLLTGCVVCNPGSAVAQAAEFPVEVVTGPEFVTGSTRMKAGTAQKLVLNMISTAVMIQLDRVKGNKMIDMKLTNNKLQDRAAKMVMSEIGVSREVAEDLLTRFGSVRGAIENHQRA